jgi:putative transcriptional regulator
MNYYSNFEKQIPEKGDLLISEPFLPDPNFDRTVVLICEHNDQGSFGFILNKPSLLKLSDVLDEVDPFQTTIHVGGPVQQDTLHFIHRIGDIIEGAEPIGEHIYWGGNFEQLKIMVANKEVNKEDVIFFLGYSGWGDGQLMDEIQEKSWIVHKAPTSEQVFDKNPENLWRDILKEKGGKFKMFSNYPTDPRLN